jgi:hypothetical protein
MKVKYLFEEFSKNGDEESATWVNKKVLPIDEKRGVVKMWTMSCTIDGKEYYGAVKKYKGKKTDENGKTGKYSWSVAQNRGSWHKSGMTNTDYQAFVAAEGELNKLRSEDGIVHTPSFNV